MGEDLLSVISKLEGDSIDQVLNLDNPVINNHVKYLKKKFSNEGYTESDFVGVSILLQHYSLELFTTKELSTLLELDLTSLEHHTNVEYEPVMFNRLKGVMDTGSLRVYSVMTNKEELNLDKVNYMQVKSYTAYQYLRAISFCYTCLK